MLPALTIVWALRHYKYVILGYVIIVLTDHKALEARKATIRFHNLTQIWRRKSSRCVQCPDSRYKTRKENVIVEGHAVPVAITINTVITEIKVDDELQKTFISIQTGKWHKEQPLYMYHVRHELAD